MTGKERRHRADAVHAINSALFVIGMWQQSTTRQLATAFDTLERYADYVQSCSSHGIAHWRRRRHEICGY